VSASSFLVTVAGIVLYVYVIVSIVWGIA